jgi:hypothetical protein
MNFRRIVKCSAVAALAASVGLTSASAQVPHSLSIVSPRPSVLFIQMDSRILSPSAVGVSPTHAKEGAIIGAVVVGIGGAVVMYNLCRDTKDYGDHSNCIGAGVGGTLLGALLGAITGSLIGGSIPKH